MPATMCMYASGEACKAVMLNKMTNKVNHLIISTRGRESAPLILHLSFETRKHDFFGKTGFWYLENTLSLTV